MQLKNELARECSMANADLAAKLDANVNGHWVLTCKAPNSYECIHNAIETLSGDEIDCSDKGLKKTNIRPATESDDEY